MNDFPRQKLKQILAKYGREICSDARRCENLLRDLCGSYRREINVLVNAIEERVPLDLLAANRSMPLELLLTRIEKRLEEQTALTADAARWAVESWASALNLATEIEIQARRKRIESASQISKTETLKSDDAAADGTPSVNRHNRVEPTKTTTTVPKAKTAPPIMRPPAQTLAPPAVLPTNNQPSYIPPVYTQPINQPAAARKGFGLFRGCAVIIFLLAIASFVLFLGVPYAIEKMRETQRERNSEPPRFPVR